MCPPVASKSAVVFLTNLSISTFFVVAEMSADDEQFPKQDGPSHPDSKSEICVCLHVLYAHSCVCVCVCV